MTKAGAAGSLTVMARVPVFLTLMLGLAAAAGCAEAPKEERQIWEGIKIADLSPTVKEKDREKARFLATVQMEIRVFELPGENVDQLDDLWRQLSAKGVSMTSYNAFSNNSFRVKSGRIEMWEKFQGLLAEAGAQRTATLSLAVPDNDTSDLPIADFTTGRTIAFVGNNLASQTVNVGPGSLVLRLRAEPIPWARGVRKIIAYPTYTLPTSAAIPQLSLMARRNEFYFAPAAFAAQMGPGDLLVLGPDTFTSEQLTLGGLFFNNPQGHLFFDPTRSDPPRIRSSARIYVLICRGITE